MEKSNASRSYDPLLSSVNNPLPLLQKKTEEKPRDQGPKQSAVFTCAGRTITLKESTLFTLRHEKDSEGNWHFKIAPFQGEQMDGKKCPLVLLFEGHVYYSKEDEPALNEAVSSETDLYHPILQIYNERDPSVDSDTCWHALDPNAFNPLQEELSTQADHTHRIEITAPTRPRSSSAQQMHHQTHKKRAAPRAKPEEKEETKPKGSISAADQRIIDSNPGSIQSMEAKSTEWVEDKAIAFNESKAQDTREYLEKADLGHLDQVRPLYKNSLRSQDKEEKTQEAREETATQLSKEQQKQIEILRSNFSV